MQIGRRPRKKRSVNPRRNPIKATRPEIVIIFFREPAYKGRAARVRWGRFRHSSVAAAILQFLSPIPLARTLLTMAILPAVVFQVRTLTFSPDSPSAALVHRCRHASMRARPRIHTVYLRTEKAGAFLARTLRARNRAQEAPRKPKQNPHVIGQEE